MEEEAFLILMLIFSGIIFLYALLIAWTKDVKLIFRNYSANIKNKKIYAVQFSKLLALISIVPAFSGIVGFLSGNIFYAMISFVACFVICVRAGSKRFMKDV